MNRHSKRHALARLLFVASMALVFAAKGKAQMSNPEPIREFANPLDVCVADPAILRHDGVYYLAGTTFGRYTSRDLVNWRRAGRYMEPAGTWQRGAAWACELAEKDGVFYLYYCAPGKTAKHRCICVARADSPADTFTPLALPMWDDGESNIDPHVFADDDGRRYLYWTADSKKDGKAKIMVAPLADNMRELAGDPVECVRPEQEWEFKWQEGPTVLKHSGVYYLMFSSRLFATPRYSVGYATAPSPLGPWTKSRHNPVLQKTDRVSGPGHNGVVRSPDGTELFACYHTHRSSAAGGARQLNLDRIRFEPDAGHPDRLIVDGPSHLPQPYPSGSKPARVILGRDEFNTFDDDRWSIWNERPDRWRVEDGALVIEAIDGDIHTKRSDARNIVLQHAPSGDWTATTRVNHVAAQDFEYAGLIVWQDSNNYVALKKVFAEELKFEAAAEINEKYTSRAASNTIGDTVWLRIVKRGKTYRCLVSTDGENWTAIAKPIKAKLLLPKVGLIATSPKSKRQVIARFEFFDLVPNQ